MHSSRMRTVRCSGHLLGDVRPGSLLRGVGGAPTEFLTHACENITFRQLLLRTVITVCVLAQCGRFE